MQYNSDKLLFTGKELITVSHAATFNVMCDVDSFGISPDELKDEGFNYDEWVELRKKLNDFESIPDMDTLIDWNVIHHILNTAIENYDKISEGSYF